MKRTVLCLALAMLLALGGQAIAQAGLCTIDQVPAATMLLPYFEVDLACDGTGITTLFSVNNASAAAAVAHVVFWTDLSVPTLDFDIYLTGFDVQTVNLRDVFCDGKIPVTADQSQDTGTDSISPQGIWSEDISFPGAFGPCGNVYPSPALNQTYLTNHLRSIHTGGRSSLYAACGGEVFGDNLARGYITIDNALRCSLLFPSDEGYFAGEEGVASNVNQLWGDYIYVNQSENFAQGDTLVHVQAFPRTFGEDDYTFYGRYVDFSGDDAREPLATTFAVRHALEGAAFDDTELIVWRDPGVPTAAPFTCGTRPSWYPLLQDQVVAFDEKENPVELCIPEGCVEGVSPPQCPEDPDIPTCFPLEAQRVSLSDNLTMPAIFAPFEIPPTHEFGWMYLNLNDASSGSPNGINQAWVSTVQSAEGRYSIGYNAIQLDSACFAESIILPDDIVLPQ